MDLAELDALNKASQELEQYAATHFNRITPPQVNQFTGGGKPRVTGGVAGTRKKQRNASTNSSSTTNGPINSPARGKGSGAVTKKRQSEAHQKLSHLPAMDESTRLAAEQRLEMLSRAAQSNSSLYDLVEANHNVNPSIQHSKSDRFLEIPSFQTERSMTSMSGTEADFMLRQIHSADAMNQASIIRDLDNAITSRSAKDQMNSLPSSATAIAGQSSKTINEIHLLKEAKRLLEEQKEQLEQQLKQSQILLSERNHETAKLDDQLQRLQRSYDQLKFKSLQDINQLKQEHEMELLRLRELHSKERASFLSSNSIISSTNPIIENQTNNNLATSQKQLLSQLDSLRNELRRSQELTEETRRNLQREYTQKMMDLETRLKSEAMELKKMITKLEDDNEQRKEENMNSNATIEQLRAKNLHLEQSSRAAIEEATRLRNDLSTMQQTVQSSYRMESTQKHQMNGTVGLMSSMGASTGQSALAMTLGVGGNTGGGSGDVESALRLAEAKHEAKLRAIMNKSEFLKSQLETERKLVVDTKAALVASQASVAAVREEMTRRIREVESQTARAVQDAELRLAESYESRMTELTILQRQVAQMTVAREELTTESSAQRQRAEALIIQNERLTGQVETLRCNLEEVSTQLRERQARDAEMQSVADASKLSSDMVLRRLDNERHYLKNQLESEITLKSELQNMLNETQQILNATKAQWQSDVDTLKETIATMKQQWTAEKSDWGAREASSNTGMEQLTSQTAVLRESLAKMRDQVRLEQLSNETLRSEKATLLQDAMTLREDLARIQNSSIENSRQAEEQIKNLQTLLTETGEVYTSEVNRYKDELQTQYSVNSRLQTEVIRMKEGEQVAVKEAMRHVPAAQLFNCLVNWRKSRLQAAFRSWSTFAMLQNVAIQFRSQVEKIVQETRAEEVAAAEQRLVVQRNAWEQELVLHEQVVRQECESEQKAMLAAAEDGFQQRLAEANEAHQLALKEAEEDAKYDLQAERERLQKTIDELQCKFSSQRELHQQELLEQMKRLTDDFQSSFANQLDEYRHNSSIGHQHALDELRLQHSAELESQKRDLQRNLHESMNALRAQLDEYAKQSTLKLKKQHEEELSSVRESHAKVLETIEEDHVTKMATLELSLLQQHNNTLQDEKREWQAAKATEICELRVQWEEETQARLAQLKSELEEASSLAEEKARLAAVAEKESAVKLEAKKWRAALAASEQRIELDAERLRVEIAADAEKQLTSEREVIQHTLQFERVKWLEQHSNEMESLRLQLEAEKQIFEETTKTRLQTEVSVQADALTAALEEKHKKEILELRSQFEEEKKETIAADKSRLEDLKRDFQHQLRTHSEERSRLLMHQQQSDEKQREVNFQKEEAARKLYASLQAEFESFKTASAEEKLQLQVTHASELDDQKFSAEIALADAVKQAREEETQRLTSDFERQLDEVQTENEKLLSQLETGLQSLRAEKDNLSSTISTLTAQVEDTEDALYDVRQQLKSTQKSYSLQIWQLAARQLLRQQRVEEDMKRIEHAAAEKLDVVQTRMQQAYNELALNYLRVNTYVYEIEHKRQLIQSTIISYRPDDLKKYRKRIQNLEFELEKVTQERDTLEDQRDSCQHEISLLTTEIKEAEELLRQHQNESSVTVNGRVNVAYARKKKRIDQEIERILEAVEHKRGVIADLDERLADSGRLRDEKEAELVDVERLLVGLLVEQQKLTLKLITGLSGYCEKAKLLSSVLKFPWIGDDKKVVSMMKNLTLSTLESDPYGEESRVPEPTMDDVLQLVEKWKQ